MGLFLDKLLSSSKLEQWNAFLGRCAGNDEEIAPIGFGITAVSLGKIGCNGQGCPVQLIGKEIISARKGFGQAYNLLGEVDGFLVDVQIFKHERHVGNPKMSSRTGEQETAAEQEALLLFTCSTALILPSAKVSRRTGEQETAVEQEAFLLITCSTALILPSAKLEAGGIEPPSRDNSNDGLYMHSRCFNLDPIDEHRHSSIRSSRLCLAGASTAEGASQPAVVRPTRHGLRIVPRSPIN